MADMADEFEKFMAKDNVNEVGTEDLWDWEKNPMLVGVLIGVEENVGKRGESNMYTFGLKDNTRVKFWGTSVLDRRLSTCIEGEEVAIKYEGLKTSEKTGNEYHDFKVFK